MVQSIKVYEGAYISTDKKTAVNGLEELYSYLMTKYLDESKAGTTLTHLYNTVTSFLKETRNSTNSSSKAESFESNASLLYSLEADWFCLKYPNIAVVSGNPKVDSEYLLVASESNKEVNLLEPDEVTYILRLSNEEFNYVKSFFFNNVLVLETSNLCKYSANIYWNNQSLCNKFGKSLAFIKFVSPKNLEAYKSRAEALVELARYIKRVLPDVKDTDEHEYLNHHLYYGYNKHFLKSSFSFECSKGVDVSTLDATGKRYLKLAKDLGYGDNYSQIIRLTTKDVLGSSYPEYLQLCNRAGLIPAEFFLFS